VLHHVLVDALMCELLCILEDGFSLDPSCYFISNSPVVVCLLPVQYTPCQKPSVCSCQTFVYNCLVTQNEYPIILQVINRRFSPFKCPNAVAVRSQTYVIYTPSLETVSLQFPTSK